MELVKSYITNNPHYKTPKIIPVKGLVLHSVGTPQPSPEVFVKIWNKDTSKYPAHIVVGTDTAYECLPCTMKKGEALRTYHVGTANAYTIGMEMTEPSTIRYTSGANWEDLYPAKTKAHVLRTYANAVNIFAQLCIFHGLDPLADGVILSHRECALRGIGTNHGDVEHIWKHFGLNMNQFRKDVKKEIDRLNNGDDEDMTQEKFDEMFMNALNAYRKSLQDNDSGTWSADSRDWAVKTGLIKGGDPLPDGSPNYMWQDFLTREQMATLLYRFKDMK